MREVTIVSQVTEKDLIAFNLVFFRSNGIIWFIGFFFVASLIVIAANGVNEAPKPALYILSGILLFAVSVFFNIKRTAKNKFIRERKVYRLTEERLYMESESSTATIAWGDFHKSVTTRKIVYLYINPNNAFLLPLGDLSSEDAEYVRDLVRRKIDRKKAKQQRLLRITTIVLIGFLVTIGIVQAIISSQT